MHYTMGQCGLRIRLLTIGIYYVYQHQISGNWV
jgi:hypothetical protein